MHSGGGFFRTQVSSGVLCQPDLSPRYLTVLRLPSKLARKLDELSHSRRADRMPPSKEAARWIDGQSSTQR